MPRTAVPPSPRLTLELVKWNDLLWLPVGVGLLVAGGLACGLRGRFPGAEASFGFIGILLLAIGLIVAAVGLGWAWKATKGKRVEFGDAIAIARLLGATNHIRWSDVTEVIFHRSESTYEQHDVDGILFVPIPGVGGLTMTTVSTKTRWLVDRYVELRGRDDNTILRIDRGAMDELAFTLWYERHLLRQLISTLGGRVDWNESGLTRASLARTNIEDSNFASIRERFLRIRELRELDLSQTGLTEAALDGLEQCESLELISGSATKIAPEALDKINKQLTGRRARAGFGFLQPQTDE